MLARGCTERQVSTITMSCNYGGVESPWLSVVVNLYTPGCAFGLAAT